jgi:hypothetical protein
MLKKVDHFWRMFASVGLGAVLSSAPGPAAALAPETPGASAVVLKHEGGAVFLSQAGRPFERLELGDTPEMRELLSVLRQLSPDGSAVTIPLDQSIVAGGGASVHKPRPAARSAPPSDRG